CRPRLSGRPAWQPDDAFPRRSRSETDDPGPAAAAQILEDRVNRFFRFLILATALLTFVVIVVGAYVRLSDAGLGCPDWPLCYGKPIPAQIADTGALAKAWKEMGHRYLAGGLGVLILLVCAFAWKLKS